jgi:hypothetical protein
MGKQLNKKIKLLTANFNFCSFFTSIIKQTAWVRSLSLSPYFIYLTIFFSTFAICRIDFNDINNCTSSIPLQAEHSVSRSIHRPFKDDAVPFGTATDMQRMPVSPISMQSVPDCQRPGSPFLFYGGDYSWSYS